MTERQSLILELTKVIAQPIALGFDADDWNNREEAIKLRDKLLKEELSELKKNRS